ncbi:MAG: DUF1826 domain-containing protein [Pseudomonadota bacterium]
MTSLEPSVNALGQPIEGGTACAAPLPKKKTTPVALVDQLSELDAVFDESIDGVLVKRSIPAFVQSALNAVSLDPAMGGRFCLPPSGVAACINEILSNRGITLSTAKRWIAGDAQSLAVQLARILCVDDVLLRVEVVNDNACRKFHRDAIRARLICTYIGPGTEYGAEAGASEPDPIETVPTGCPILLKGKAWRGSSPSTLLHRSPPIEGTETSRLVVVIDEATPALL